MPDPWRPTLAEAAALVGGSLEGAPDPGARVRGFAPLDVAGPEELAFLSDRRRRAEAERSRAAAVLVAPADAGLSRPRIVVDDPYLAFARLQQRFFPRPQGRGRRHPSAVVHETARIAADVDIGPCAVVGEGAEIGAGSILGAGVHVGPRARIGRDCILHAHAVVMDDCVLGDRVVLHPGAVVGADGFGLAWDGEGWARIPQVGRVIVGDDVEIGANACVDRGALGDTVIEDDVRLDNLVQIGHNARIGAHTAMAAQAGVSGSTRIGQGCLVGGQAGFAGHLSVADRARIGAQAGVIGDIRAPGEYWGTPAIEKRRWLRAFAALLRLAGRKAEG